MNRRDIIRTGAATLALTVLATPSLAQDWKPAGPITFVVPYAAGGGVDTYARPLVTSLSESLGVPVIIANKDGAGGLTGAAAAAAARPDGQTYLVAAAGGSCLARCSATRLFTRWKASTPSRRSAR